MPLRGKILRARALRMTIRKNPVKNEPVYGTAKAVVKHTCWLEVPRYSLCFHPLLDNLAAQVIKNARGQPVDFWKLSIFQENRPKNDSFFHFASKKGALS